MHDPVRVERLTPNGILHRRRAEQHERADTEVGQRLRFGDEARDGVLHHARQRRDGLGRIDALTHEQRRHQAAGVQAGFGDEFAHGRCGAQPAWALHRER